jgi:hypothetical protein
MEWRRRFGGLKIENAIGGEIAVKKTHAVCAVRLIRHPNEAIGPDTKKVRTIVIAMLNAKTQT